MSSSMDSDGLATMRNHLASDLDSASGSESDDEQLEQLEQDCVAEDDTSGKVWYAVVEYFFQSRNEDELRVHLSWCVARLSCPGSPRRALTVFLLAQVLDLEAYSLDRALRPVSSALQAR